jgi:hypothetical protein
MSLFDRLLIAHILGDWLFQTEWQATNKERNWRAMAAHVGVYHLIVLAVLAHACGLADPRIYGGVAFLALTHALIDRRWPVLRLMRALRIVVNREPDRLLGMAIDQGLHLIFLALLVAYLGGNP